VSVLFASAEDVNGHGLPDLVLHFERAALMSMGDLTQFTTSLTLQATGGCGRSARATIRKGQDGLPADACCAIFQGSRPSWT
jgi:hypothetical protein